MTAVIIFNITKKQTIFTIKPATSITKHCLKSRQDSQNRRREGYSHAHKKLASVKVTSSGNATKIAYNTPHTDQHSIAAVVFAPQ